MWLWLSILISLSAAAAPSTSTGPAPASEAPILWQQGQQAWEKGDYTGTIGFLSRLVDRHPSAKNSLSAQLLLGQAYLNRGEPKDSARAIAVLRKFVHGAGVSNSSLEGRLFLSRAYLKEKKYAEATSSLFEILEPKRRKVAVPPEMRIAALIIKGEINFALKRFDRAEQNRDAAERELSKLSPKEPTRPRLIGQNSLLHLQIHTERCSRYPSAPQLSEEQVMDQISRRGTCELEGAVLFGSVLGALDAPSIEAGAKVFLQSHESFHRFCTQPPGPQTRLIPPDEEDDDTEQTRTPEQLKRYSAELADALRAPCQRVFQQLLEQIPQWRATAPGATKAIETIQKRLEQLQSAYSVGTLNTASSLSKSP